MTSEKGWPLRLLIRTGVGGCQDPSWKQGVFFSDEVKTVSRVPRFHRGWQSVTYQCRRYQLMGGVRTPYFICLNNPIKGGS